MKNLKNKIKNMKGITLVSLVVTIIVLIVLAGISLNIILSNNGIIDKARIAKEENEKNAASETMTLKITECQMKSYAENGKLPDLQYLADRLCEDNDIAYVNLQKQSVAAINNKITIGENTSIFTKLEKYPYEFEINSSLQLASIDGVQVASNETNITEDLKQQLKNELKQEILAEIKDELNPTGTIIAYSANSLPDGYLKCEGQEVSRTEYSKLFNIIGTTYGSGDGSTTFNVPDLRGEFLRGTGTNSHTGNGAGNGNGAAVGEHQDATQMQEAGDHASQVRGMNYTSNLNKDTFGLWNVTGNWVNGTAYTTLGRWYSARPTNTSVLYCIKY